MSNVYQVHKPNSGGGDYLKLKDGQKVKLRIVSEPAIVTYDGVKLRYQWLVFNKTDGVVQSYEAGSQVFSQFASLYDDWGDIQGFDVTIARTGSGQFDTSYTVTPLPKSADLTTQEKEKVEEALSKFPGSKARLLEDYIIDKRMPETIEVKARQEQEPLPNDEDAPIDPSDIPF